MIVKIVEENEIKNNSWAIINPAACGSTADEKFFALGYSGKVCGAA